MESIQSIGAPLPDRGHSGRMHGLDAYRGALMMLGIVLHGAIPFLEKHRHEGSPISIGCLEMIMHLIHTFRMPAFFLLSGFFAALLWKRYGLRGMRTNRVQRILLPFLACLPLLYFAVTLTEQLVGRLKDGSPHPLAPLNELDFWRIFFPESFAHLWFLYDLLWISAFCVLVVRFWDKRGRSFPSWQAFAKRNFECPKRCLLILGGVNFLWCFCAGGLNALQLIDHGWAIIPTNDRWIPSPSIVVFYGGYYVLGWLLFTSGADLNRSKDRAWTMVLLGLVFAGLHMGGLGLLELSGAAEDKLSLAVIASYASTVAMGSLTLFAFTRGMMGLFLRYASEGTFVWRYLSDASYWSYLIHLTFVLSVPILFLGWDVPIFVQYLANVVLSTILCLLTYDLFVRSTFIGRFLNGRRYERGPLKWRVVGAVIVLGVGSMGSAQIIDHRAKILAWTERGGTLSVLPFDFNIAPLGQVNVEVKGAHLESCLPVDEYVYCAKGVPIDEAHKGCAALGGRLIQLETEEKNIAVTRAVWAYTKDPFWIDLNDLESEGEWVWRDGTEVGFTNWRAGEPNNCSNNEDCAHANFGEEGVWNDLPCEVHQPYICEFTQPPESGAEGTRSVLADLGPAPSGLSGTWVLNTRGLQHIPSLMNAPPKYLKQAEALVNSLQIKVVFGQDQLRMSGRILGKIERTVLPFRMVKDDGAERHIAIIRDREESTYHLTLDGETLFVRSSKRRTVLTRQR